MTGSRYTRIVGGIALAALIATVLIGCSAASSSSGSGSKTSSTGSSATSATASASALTGLKSAFSALSTMAPDAKLLLVQTAQAVTPTSPPVWVYLFGSPSTDKTFVVYTRNGVSMGAQEYGTAGLKAAEWKKVPTTTTWEIDSDAAYSKALAASKAKGTPAQYIMGLITYKPQESTSTMLPFVWDVEFDTSGTVGAVAASFAVSAHTGDTQYAK